MLFLKLGKKEHLQQLKEGIIHFSPLSSYIDDSTCFRGDRLEGKLLADLNQTFLINGVDVIPYVQEIVHTYDGFESILSFSVSKIDFTNCHISSDGLYTPNADFIEEMSQFGSHVLIFSSNDFILELGRIFTRHKCNISYKSVFYCNKSDHEAIVKYFQVVADASDPYEYCFIKDASPYAKQNEWRAIIHDLGNEFPVDRTGGVNIQTAFHTEMPIFESVALRTLQVSEDLLK